MTDGLGSTHELDVDRRETEVVMAFERRERRDPEKIEHFNPGYDIKAQSRAGAVRFIESMSGPWRGFSVGLCISSTMPNREKPS